MFTIRRWSGKVLPRNCLWLVVLWAVAAPLRADETERAGLELFDKKIRPVLITHCYQCHAAEAKEVKGGLLLDSRRGMRDGGDSGAAVVPGSLEESLLIQAIRYDDDFYEMPPKGKLPDHVIQDFVKWVKLGAPDPRDEEAPPAAPRTTMDLEEARQFWAFQPPRKLPAPAVKDRDWPQSEIDFWILAGMEQHELRPAPDADRRTLLRRLTYDLHGLPPTPREIEEFVRDQTPGAYQRIVDRLLASPRFGERWGRHWLDVTRYADSNGLDINLTFHNAWRYRDYVIDSLDRDKPFSRFVVEQIAGDLLPYGNDQQHAEQLIATGFLTIGAKMLSERDKEKLRMDVVDEQIDTTGRAFLGMTLGCARCHDHKFDPVPTTEYYALAGIFRNTTTVAGIKLGNAFVSGWNVRPLPIPPEHADALARHEQAVAAITKPRNEAQAELKKLQQAAARRKREDLPGILVDDTEAQIEGSWKHSTYSPQFVGKGYIHDEKTGKGEKSVTFTPQLPEAGEYEVRVSYAGAEGRATAVPITIVHAGGQQTVSLNQAEVAPLDRLFKPLGRFRFEAGKRGSVTISTTGTEDGYVIADSVQFIPVALLEKDAATATAATDGDATDGDATDGDATDGDATDGDATDGDAAADDEQPAAALITELQARIKKLDAQLAELNKQTPPPRPMAMAVQDVSQPEDYHVAVRGNVHRLAQPVPRGFVTAPSRDDLPVIPNDESGRLQLARWIASPRNSLTARVIVNRIWHHLLGEGLVRSMDNFGHLGERPTHPELLDNLAVQFVQRGWSLKAAIRSIVLSRVYRLGSRSRAASLAADPPNRWLSRAHRRRLPAEAIRDTLLAVSGELDLARGGSQVAKLGERALDNDSGSPIDTDTIHRRSVYLPLVRSDTPPLLAAFDFADPEMVSGRRATTTVATQALLMMNSPFVLRRAKVAAQQLLKDEPADAERRVSLFYERALARPAEPGERRAALAYIEDYSRVLREQPSSASRDIDLDAWASFCQAIFASTEFRFLD